MPSNHSLLIAAALAWAATLTAEGAMPEIIAHRGASHDAPENTVAAFQLAWDQGADGIEGDFRLTLDGRIVCCHDATTKRTGDRNLEVWLSLFDELRTVDVGKWKGDGWEGEQIPSVEEVLGVVRPGKKIYIEIYTPQTVHILKRAIDQSGLRPEQIVIISFDRGSVAAAKKLLGNVKAFWIVSLKKDKSKRPPTAIELVAVLKRIRADGLDCSASDTVDARFVETIRQAGFEFHVWTVNDAEAAKRFAGYGVTSITTDRPAWIREHLSACGR